MRWAWSSLTSSARFTYPCVLLHQTPLHRQLNEDLDFSICAEPDFKTNSFKSSSVCAWDEMSFSPLTDYKGNSWCLQQETMSAFGQLNPTRAPSLVPTGTTMLLGSFWSGESPWRQPTSDTAFTPCCGFVFQQLGRLCILQRAYDCNNNKQRTSEVAGLMWYAWKVPGVSPLKTVWILCAESWASFQTACFGKAVLLLTWWGFLTKHVSICFILKPRAVLMTPCPDGLGWGYRHILLSCVYLLSPCGSLAHGVGFEVVPCLRRFLAAHALCVAWGAQAAVSPCCWRWQRSLLPVWGMFSNLAGTSRRHFPPSEARCCGEAASEVPGQPAPARLSRSLMLISIKLFAPEV